MTCQAQGNDEKRYIVCIISTKILVGNEFLCNLSLENDVRGIHFPCKAKSNICFSFPVHTPDAIML
jgi:hypothetical protein